LALRQERSELHVTEKSLYSKIHIYSTLVEKPIITVDPCFRMMAIPPPAWDCHFLEDMDSYSSPADGSEGELWFIISGSDPVSIRTLASAILLALTLSR